MINFNQFINENLNEAFKFTEEQVVDVANLIAAAISKLDKVSAEVHDLEFDKGRGAGFDISMDGEKYAGGSYSVRPNGDVVNDAIGNSFPNAVYAKIGDSDVKKVMKNIQKFESLEVNESLNKSDIQYQLSLDYTGNTKPKVIKLNKKRLEVKYGYKIDPKNVIDSIKSIYPEVELEHIEWKNAISQGGIHSFAIKESVVTEAKKFYTTKEIVKLAQAAGDFVLDAKDAIQDLSVAYGDKVPAKELDKVLANYDLEIEDLMESINRIEENLFDTITQSALAIFSIMYAFQLGGYNFLEKGTFKKLFTDIKNGITNFKKDKELWRIIEKLKNDEEVIEAAKYKVKGPRGGKRPQYESDEYFREILKNKLTSKEYDYLYSFSQSNKKTANINKGDFTKQNIFTTKAGIGETYINEGSKRLDEGRKVTLKRRYTENHPAITAGKHARIRNKMLEAIGDGKITQEEFDNILKELSNSGKRWSRNNAKYFNVSEEGISLSKFGRRALASITVNEKTTKNPEVWVPGAFDKALSKMPNSKITYDVVKDMAKKHKVFLDDAIAYVEYGWDLDLQENKNNKNNQMKSNFIYESFSAFVENELNEAKFNKKSLMKALKGDDGIILVNGQEYIIYNPNNNNDDNTAMWGNDTIIALDQDGEEHEFKYSEIERFSESVVTEAKLNEAFKSNKLASLFRNTRGQIDKNLTQAFYRMSRIKMDQVEDHDIIEMDPKTAYKDKRQSAVYFYFTRNEKENPYATSEYRDDRRIPANTLLAITNGKNEFYGVNWKRFGEKGYVMSLGSVGDSAGIGKSHSRYGGTGLSNMKRVSDVADVAYVIDLNILRNRYDASAIRDTRSAAQKGAIAFKTDKEFKQENLNRYNAIIANRAAAMPIDKMVADAIDTLSAQIKDALVKGEKTKYNEILLGRTSKGREAKLQDAANHMQRILDDFQRYVSYTNQAEEEKKAGYGGDYYAREVKNYAKSITDRIKQIETFSYAW